MPSSLIFASLVVIWLLILVPAVARHQQEVARPSPAALSGRVLERRPRRLRGVEVDRVDEAEDVTPVAARVGGVQRSLPRPPVEDRVEDPAEDPVEDPAEDPVEDEELGSDDPPPERGGRRWERPPVRYRPGRGGFDPEAAALAADARYAVRQRVVLGLLVAAGLSALVAAFALPELWVLHAVVDVGLLGYLGHLRRQVRVEEAIRERRVARMAGFRRASGAGRPLLDGRSRRGPGADLDLSEDAGEDADDRPEPLRVTGRPVGVLSACLRTAREDSAVADLAVADLAEPALPSLQPVPPPPIPAGTSLVDVDDEDAELADLDDPVPRYRHAAGA